MVRLLCWLGIHCNHPTKDEEQFTLDKHGPYLPNNEKTAVNISRFTKRYRCYCCCECGHTSRRAMHYD